MRSDKMRLSAEGIAAEFGKEDGLRGGIDAFHNHLPINDMVCDVSLFLPEAHAKSKSHPIRRTLLACRWCEKCGLKMSREVDVVVHERENEKEHIRHDYRPVDWGSSSGPENVLSGTIQGVAGFGQECLSALGGLITEPIKGSLGGGGMRGGRGGVVTGLKGLVTRPLMGGLILVDKSSAGVRAHLQDSKGKEGEGMRRYVFFDKVHKVSERSERAM